MIMESSLKKNDLIQIDNGIFRVLEVNCDKALLIDCVKRTMPGWKAIKDIVGFSFCDEDELHRKTGYRPAAIEELKPKERREAYNRFSSICGILSFVGSVKERCMAIWQAAEHHNKSKQTIRTYLCIYLIYQTVSALAPKEHVQNRDLTEDERNIRWGLNRFFYNKNKNSLKTAFTLLLKERYCDATGKLLAEHPSFHQFKYFYYKKYRDMEKYFITREGMKAYQRDRRPLVGGGIPAYAPCVGTAMVDSTICDIYLINESGELVGRPILTLCVDAWSRLIMGFCLSWEGGTYSLRALMDHVLTDKVQYCESLGIKINREDWDCKNCLPLVIVSDRGREYTGDTFEQICDLGVSLVNLESFRPDWKSVVEISFSLQNIFKSYLGGHGVINPDFQQRGAPDYRKQAHLTLRQFEVLITHCVLFMNTARILEDYPYTDQMLFDKVAPYASAIWNWGRLQSDTYLIQTTKQLVQMTLLPRTLGKFTRSGLVVNKLRYFRKGYTNQFLKGEKAIVAYNPENVNSVYLIERDEYKEFCLIESRFVDKTFEDVAKMRIQQKGIMDSEQECNLQAKIDLANHIQTITESGPMVQKIRMDSVRQTHMKERVRNHQDLLKERN